MIPELNPDDYDTSEIPEAELAVIVAAISTFEKKRQETLISGATKNYLKGVKTAYQRLDKKFVSSEVEDDVYSFLETYQKQIQEGYTVIQGEKVYWLRDRILNERQALFDIISKGVTEGKSPDKVTKQLQDYFGIQRYQAERIARTETAYVQSRGTIDRYKKFGVERVKWLLGRHPCERCQNYGGRIFEWDKLPGEPPLHSNCTCAIVAVLDPNEKETPYIPTPKEQPIEKPVREPKVTPVKTEPVKKVPVEKPKVEPVKKPDVLVRKPEEVQKIIRDNEAVIKNRKTEKGIIFDKNGNILLEKEGKEKSVELTDNELKLLSGNILSHNHPSAGSFSGQDIKTACTHGLNEVRATGDKGTYIMKMKDGSNFNKELWNEKISDIYDKEFKTELTKHNIRMANNELTKEESVQLLSKVLWVKVTRQVPELEYTFVKW